MESPSQDSAKSLDLKWVQRYQEKKSTFLYPTEWVVRTLAGGNYPRLKIDKSRFCGARILDMGCGDGRNLSLLMNLGFKVHACEISETLIDELKQQASQREWEVDFRVGRNTSLPYANGYFDFVLSCSSFYYLSEQVQFETVIQEIGRVCAPGGLFVGNIPDPHNAVLRAGKQMPDGSVLIQDDPFSIRNGVRFMVAHDANQVAALLKPAFKPLAVGHQADDFYGLNVSGYIFVASRV